MSEWPVLQQLEDCFVEDNFANITLDTLWPIQNGRCFAENILNTFLSNENVWFSIKKFIEFCPRGLKKNVSELDQIIAWR